MEYKVESISYSASSYTFVTDYSPNLCEDAILVFVNFKDNNIPDNILDYVASPAGTLKNGPLPGTVLQAFGNYRYKGTLKVYSKEDPTIKDECNLRKLFRDPEEGYDFVCYITVKPGTRFVLHTSGMYARTAEEQSMSFHTDSSLIALDDVVFTMDTNQKTTYTAVFTAGNTPGTAIVTNTSNFPKIDKRKWVVKVGNDNDYVPVKKIEFSPRSVDELFKGETTVVEAIVSPSNATYKDIDWSVSMSGKIITERLSPTLVRIKAFGAGYSRLIAKNCDDSATAWLPVFSQEKSTANDEIRISQKTLYLASGESYTLTAEVTHDGVTRPARDGEVGFRSTNSAVAKVGQGGTIRGVVTGISAGTAVIEAWIGDHPSKKDICTVYVDGGGGEQPEPEVEVSSVSLFKDELSLKVGSTYNLVAFIHRGDTKTTASASDIAWSSSDSSVASISYGKITAKSEGVATIMATSTEDRTKSATCVVTVTASSGGDDDPEPQPKPQDGTDVILRIDYEDGEFKAPVTLFAGNLGFDENHPIESVVYYETEEIQKIYWVDGQHVLRFMNFMADDATIAKWNDGDNTHFDSNRAIKFSASATIEKDNSGNPRPNGVVQYMLTYFDRFGEETGVAWMSDLVYLSPTGVGGSADGNNNNSVKITFKNLDRRFTHFRVYSVFQSSLGSTTAYIVASEKVDSGEVIVIDDGAHLTVEDPMRLLYLGSQTVVPGTMTHKDQTLFLGDLNQIDENYDELEDLIRSTMLDASTGLSTCINFEYTGGASGPSDIPYVENRGAYPYENQLKYTSSEILSFKGGEKYRFALCFRTQSGVLTRAFWIGDAVNHNYPIIDKYSTSIHRIVARCIIPQVVLDKAAELNLQTVQMMIAEATYSDRSVKAQGILNPTMFNTWERFNSRLYSQASWIFRPRNAGIACTHFQPVQNATSSFGEIQCNYWIPEVNEYGETTEIDPTPYFQYDYANDKYIDKFDGVADDTHLMIVYDYWQQKGGRYRAAVSVLRATLTDESARNNLESFGFYNDFNTNTYNSVAYYLAENAGAEGKTFDFDGFSIFAIRSGIFGKRTGEKGIKAAWDGCINFLKEQEIKDPNLWVDYETYKQWLEAIPDKGTTYARKASNAEVQYNIADAMDVVVNGNKWMTTTPEVAQETESYFPAYYRKHMMFVDENILTLNSPEFDYETVSLDKLEGCKLRIVGVAKITGSYSDYVVDAYHGKLAGNNLISTSFVAENSRGILEGLTAWPLWNERDLILKPSENPNPEPTPELNSQDDVDHTQDDYIFGAGSVNYWMYLWNKSGKISGYTDADNNEYSQLHSKTFATLRFSYATMYNSAASDQPSYSDIELRHFNYVASQYVGLNIGGENKYYDGNVNMMLSLPGSLEYPVLYSSRPESTEKSIESEQHFLTSKTPVQLEYASSPHVVIVLPTDVNASDSEGKPMYKQTILPFINFGHHFLSGQFQVPLRDEASSVSGGLLPWIDYKVVGDYPYKEYTVDQKLFPLNFGPYTVDFDGSDEYLFIGELYMDYDDPFVEDKRYGGITASAVAGCRFIPAGPQYKISSASAIYADQGDTYFQRWDCMKTKPAAGSAINNVIDIASVMVETHINIDGRTDLHRGMKYLASVPVEEFGSLNDVYSKQNDYDVRHDLDTELESSNYQSSITWTLAKSDAADIDEWSHITLANTLKLDGDKGRCVALRRFQNSIIAFQEKGIAEVMFNSRTQIATNDGVPVEIANSGKVDGKRYITNKYGCLNKWSIVEGKNGLYFVDNINKAFCSFSDGIQNLSATHGFDAWMRWNNDITSWTPDKFNNIVSFYDRIHSDVYLVRKEGDEENAPALVYNELLGAFTSFFDYGSVPMMANVKDRFVSFRDKKLWLQNEGAYCKFFGVQYPFWVQYRTHASPYTDKIWTNVEYRADFYRVLNGEEEAVHISPDFMSDDVYQKDETFTFMRFWNEYQTTAFEEDYNANPVKRFRIWRLAIPRAIKSSRNIHGLDRIRNPWLNLLFKKSYTGADDECNQDLMQLHDVVVTYFE